MSSDDDSKAWEDVLTLGEHMNAHYVFLRRRERRTKSALLLLCSMAICSGMYVLMVSSHVYTELIAAVLFVASTTGILFILLSGILFESSKCAQVYLSSCNSVLQDFHLTLIPVPTKGTLSIVSLDSFEE